MKISLKLISMLIGLLFSVNLLAMDTKELNKKPASVVLSESKEEKEKEELGFIKIELPQTWGPEEKLNVTEEETFTAETFAELIESQSKRDGHASAAAGCPD